MQGWGTAYGNGTINPNDEAKMRLVFNSMDTDGNQSLSKSEIKEAMKKCNSYPSNSQLDQIMNEFDANHDGQIDFNEFKGMISNMKSGKYDEPEDKSLFNNRDDNVNLSRMVLDKN